MDVSNQKLYSAKIEVLKKVSPREVPNVCDKALASSMEKKHKLEFAACKLDIVQILGLSVAEVKHARDQVMNLQGVVKEILKSKGKFKCNICVELFANEKIMKAHQKRMHKTVKKCNRCNEDLASKLELSKHIKTCPFRCTKCPYSSLRSNNVKLHARIHK